MEEVLKNKEEEDLWCHGLERREGNLVGRHSKRLGHWVESPNLHASMNKLCLKSCEKETYSRKLDGEVREQNLLSAGPLLFRCGDFGGLELPLAEVRHSVNDNPRDTTPKVHNLDPC